MKRLIKEEGQTLVLTTLCMGVLIGSLGMAIDVGMLLRSKRNMQIAADGAALAGATALFYGQNATTAATAAAKVNGVDNSVTGNTVIVTSGQALGTTACASCVKVQLAKPASTIFMQFLGQWLGGNPYATVNVAAKAIAGAPSSGQACVYVMDKSASKALQIHGSGAILMPDCGVYVNSSASDALCVTGSASKSTFPWIAVHGQQPGNGNCGGNLNGATVAQNAPVETTPFGNLTGPTPVSGVCPAGSGVVNDAATTTISGPFHTSGGGTYCFKQAVTLSAGASLGDGLYVFSNGLTIGSGNVTVGTTTNGATLDVFSGSYSQNTNSALTIYAPTAGTYNAIALMQPASNTNAMSIQFGSSGATFDGMIYAPASFVTMHDQGGGGVTATGVVAGTMYINGALNIENYSDYSNNKNTSPFRVVTLVG